MTTANRIGRSRWLVDAQTTDGSTIPSAALKCGLPILPAQPCALVVEAVPWS